MFKEEEVIDGRYQIRRLISSGGMGEVYLARRVLLGDDVAIKVIKGAADSGTVLRERFLKESRACASLHHPHIVGILDFNIHPGGQPYLVMEYLNGPSLQQEIALSGGLDPGRVYQIISPICAALEVAHTRGIVHRDLKPANIVSQQFESGEIIYKIVDFGLVAIRSATSDITTNTDPGAVLGTVSYASPEQLGSESTDARSDIYSLGAVVYEMLTGRPPFEASTTLDLVMKHLNTEPRPPSDLRPGIPPWLDKAVLKALEKRPEKRWQAVVEFGRALRSSDQGEFDPLATQSPAQGLLGKYQLGRVLARGRLGSLVYEGMHRAMGHPVAIRVLRRQPEVNWSALKTRFLQEARNLQISHPSIIQVRDYGDDGSLIYTVTDLLPGKYLREVLTESGALPWLRLHRLVSHLIGALGAIHRRGALILGLSPGIVRLLDSDEGERLMVSSAGIWQVQDLLATVGESTLRGVDIGDDELRYVAPELFMGKPADVRSDIYTVGLISYEMATGSRAFEATSLPELLGKMLKGEVRDPNKLAPSLPELAGHCILKCIAPERSDRFADVGEVASLWKSISPS